MGGALPAEALLNIMEQAGFHELAPLIDEVTDEYARKWGFGLEIQEFIQRGLFIGKKS